MATIEERKNKNGAVSYRITVAAGIGANGKQIRRRKTWTPAPGLTKKQIEKEKARIAADFEREIEQGYQIDNTQKFADYANYVLALKVRTGLKPRTEDRYRDMLTKRILPAIGHIKLTDLRPQHLNNFYKNLSEYGIREDGNRATPRMDVASWMNRKKYTCAALARKAGIAASTMALVQQGKTVTQATAEKVAAAMGQPVKDVFKLTQDTTPLSNKTVMEHHRLIHTILAQAEKEMLIPYNPAAKATPPKVEKKEPVYYQPEQMDEILEALDSAPLKWKALTYLMIDTGCRRGEAVGAKWENLDFATGTFKIDCAVLYSNHHGTYAGGTKTGKTRIVKLAPETLALLKRHRAAQNELRLIHGERWIDTPYIFTQENGSMMNPDSITGWLDKFAKEKGLPHIHPHAFRHTAASNMIAAGVDLVTTAGELGHANASTTATIYAHRIQEANAKAYAARSSVFDHRKKDPNTPREKQA